MRLLRAALGRGWPTSGPRSGRRLRGCRCRLSRSRASQCDGGVRWRGLTNRLWTWPCGGASEPRKGDKPAMRSSGCSSSPHWRCSPAVPTCRWRSRRRKWPTATRRTRRPAQPPRRASQMRWSGCDGVGSATTQCPSTATVALPSGESYCLTYQTSAPTAAGPRPQPVYRVEVVGRCGAASVGMPARRGWCRTRCLPV